MVAPYLCAIVVSAVILCAAGALQFANSLSLRYGYTLPLDRSDAHLQNALSSIQAATHASLCLTPPFALIPFVCGAVEVATAPATPFVSFTTGQRALFAMLTDSSVMKNSVIVPLLTIRDLSGCPSISGNASDANHPSLLSGIYEVSRQVIESVIDLQLHMELSIIATAAIHTELLASLKALRATTWFIRIFVDRPPVDMSGVLEISRNATVFSTHELLSLTQRSRLLLAQLLLQLNQLSFEVHRGRASATTYPSATRHTDPIRLPSSTTELLRIAHLLMTLANHLDVLEDLLLSVDLGEHLPLASRTYRAPVDMAIFYLRRDLALYQEMLVALHKVQETSVSRMGLFRCNPA